MFFTDLIRDIELRERNSYYADLILTHTGEFRKGDLTPAKSSAEIGEDQLQYSKGQFFVSDRKRRFLLGQALLQLLLLAKILVFLTLLLIEFEGEAAYNTENDDENFFHEFLFIRWGTELGHLTIFNGENESHGVKALNSSFRCQR